MPEKNEEKKAILETYTKEHSAEYQSQALIDLAISLNKKIKDISQIEKVLLPKLSLLAITIWSNFMSNLLCLDF